MGWNTGYTYSTCMIMWVMRFSIPVANFIEHLNEYCKISQWHRSFAEIKNKSSALYVEDLVPLLRNLLTFSINLVV